MSPGSRRAASSSARGSPSRSASASCRCARRASCPARRSGRTTRSSTASTRSRSTPTCSMRGDKVLLVDDLIATGGTALAAVRLLRRTGATVAARRLRHRPLRPGRRGQAARGRRRGLQAHRFRGALTPRGGQAVRAAGISTGRRQASQSEAKRISSALTRSGLSRKAAWPCALDHDRMAVPERAVVEAGNIARAARSDRARR